MKFIIFFIYIPFVYSASHTLMTTYKGLNEKAVAGTPEISAVTTLDEQEIHYYDSDTGTRTPKQGWWFASTSRLKKYTEIRERVQETNKINITVLMQQLKQSNGVHMYQRMYGCVWDDTTDVSDGFDQHSYDGNDFISLDLKEGRYTAHVPEAEPTVMKWNNDREQLDFLKQYYKHECIDWLKEFFSLSRETGIVTVLTGKSLTTEPTQNPTESIKPASYYLYWMIPVCIIPLAVCYYACRKYLNKQKHSTGKHTVKYDKAYPPSNPSDEPATPDNLSEELLIDSPV